MPKLKRRTISNRTVKSLTARKDTVFWDRDLPGFGVRIYPTGSKYYVVQARGPRGAQRLTVGRHGVIDAACARRRAALAIARIKAGENPRPQTEAARTASGPTVAELARRYLEEHVAVRCKPGTARTFRTVIDVHIVPSLGRRRIGAVTVSDVTHLHHRLRATPTQANLTVDTLSRIYRMAEARGQAAEGQNPCRAVVRYRKRRRERFLTDVEFERLGRALQTVPDEGGASAESVAAIRLLMLTGCRCNEILSLNWTDVDLQARELKLRDAKTGARIVPLSPSAVDLLAQLGRASDSEWVIPGPDPDKHMKKLDNAWRTIRSRAGLEDVRLHDLRHSFASRALALGESLPMIGKLLGHRRVESTARYAHLARDSVHAAAARIARSIGGQIL